MRYRDIYSRTFGKDFSRVSEYIIADKDFSAFAWISENIATIIICAVLIAVVAAIIAGMIRNKKRGKSSCGCGCSDCPMIGSCHPKK